MDFGWDMSDDLLSSLDDQLQTSNSYSQGSNKNTYNSITLQEKKLRYKYKRLECLDNIVSKLDELFFIELFALYYLEYVDIFASMAQLQINSFLTSSLL